jgi:hypothetical protein
MLHASLTMTTRLRRLLAAPGLIRVVVETLIGLPEFCRIEEESTEHRP